MQTYTKRHTQHMVRRILDVVGSASAEELQEGLDWYVMANLQAAKIGDRHALPTTRVCGIIAALSPMCGWQENLRRADALITTRSSVGLGSDKALAILDGGRPEVVLGGPKVRAFYTCLDMPARNHGSVVIDRHAFDVAVGRETDDKTRKVLERKGQYDLFADAYRKAAERHRPQPRPRPHELQAIAWVVWRNRKSGGGPTFGA